MPARAFIDSSIFIYSFATDAPMKRDRAREIIGSNQVVLSSQVLQECVHVLRRRMGQTPDRAAERVRPLIGFEVVPLTVSLVEKAWAIASRYGLSTYDAAIIAAALQAKCSVIYTEDLQSGQTFESLRIVNPFLN